MKLIAIILTSLMLFNAPVEEQRTCHIVMFNLASSSFIVEDEDGFEWEFPFEAEGYVIGQEYTLHLPTNGDPYID